MDYTSAGSLIVAIFALLLSFFNGTKKNTKEDSSQIATILTKLDSLSGDMREIKNDIADLRQSMLIDHDKIIKLELSLETAWKRIDEIREIKEVR